jgi:Mce-associated membrane protein
VADETRETADETGASTAETGVTAAETGVSTDETGVTAAGTADETGVSTDETADETADETRETAAEPGEPAGPASEASQTAEPVAEASASTAETSTTPDKTDETTAAADETHTAADETPAIADEAAAEPSAIDASADETTAAADETSTTPDKTDETTAAADETHTAADETGGETHEGADEKPAEDAKAGGGRTRLAAILLGAAAVVLAGFGVLATLEAHSLRSTAAPQNVAVTDGAATSAVKRQVTSAVNTVFSYNYANTAATRQAAQGLLTGPAIRQYNTYFALVTKDAPAQKLVVTTRVTNSGVELLSGNQAQVLIFANQQDTRAGTKQTSYAGALFAVTAVRQGSRWKIENINTFNGQQ